MKKSILELVQLKQSADEAHPTTAAQTRTVEQVQQSRRASGLTGELLLQMKGGGGSAVHDAAAHGVQGTGDSLPHLKQIQESFGRHDVSQVQAHTGANAQRATQAMGAEAYATGNHVAFKGGTPSLHTAAHEAAHVVQQRAGVSLKGGVGEVGDKYEQHADAVADAVVQGRSAESLLDGFAGGGASSGVQRKEVQFELTRGSNTGWGYFGWVEGGKELWEKLDRKFNTELGALKLDLQALKAPTSSLEKALGVLVEDIDNTLSEYDGDIKHENAEALDKLLDKILSEGRALKTKVEQTAEKIALDARAEDLDPLIERLGEALYSLKMGNFGKGLSKGRKNLLSRLQSIRDNTSKEYDTTALTEEVEGVEGTYHDAAEKFEEQQAKKEKARLEKEKEEAALEAEGLRLDEVKKKLKAKVPNYNSLLRFADNDVDKLYDVAKRIKSGDGGKLQSSLQVAGSAADLTKLMDVHGTKIDAINKLLHTIGSGKNAELEKMLKAISSGEEDTLNDILGEVKSKDLKYITPLLGKLGAKTLNELLEQGDAKQLNTLFVTRKVNVAKTRTLLSTDASDEVVALLTKIPDSDFLVKLQPLAGDQLGSLVADLPHNATSIKDVKKLLAKEETKLDDVLDKDSVKKARGLLTDAGAEIDMTSVADLGTKHEKKHVQAALEAIASGTAQTLTHSGGAKFGEEFDNNQGRLPGTAGAGGYKEYYVEKDPSSSTYHGERRLVKHDDTGHIYYTDDHYGSFKRIA